MQRLLNLLKQVHILFKIPINQIFQNEVLIFHDVELAVHHVLIVLQVRHENAKLVQDLDVLVIETHFLYFLLSFVGVFIEKLLDGNLYFFLFVDWGLYLFVLEDV
jgi:hypothetical protein